MFIAKLVGHLLDSTGSYANCTSPISKGFTLRPSRKTRPLDGASCPAASVAPNCRVPKTTVFWTGPYLRWRRKFRPLQLVDRLLRRAACSRDVPIRYAQTARPHEFFDPTRSPDSGTRLFPRAALSRDPPPAGKPRTHRFGEHTMSIPCQNAGDEMLVATRMARATGRRK